MEKFYLVRSNFDLGYFVFFKDYQKAWDFCIDGNTEIYFDETGEEEVSDEVIAELTKDTYNDYYHIYEEKFADEG